MEGGGGGGRGGAKVAAVITIITIVTIVTIFTSATIITIITITTIINTITMITMINMNTCLALYTAMESSPTWPFTPNRGKHPVLGCMDSRPRPIPPSLSASTLGREIL